MDDQAENNIEDPVVEAAVWGRGGEGPHAFVAPEHHSQEEDAAQAIAHDTADGAISNTGDIAINPVLTADAKVVQSVFAVAPVVVVEPAHKLNEIESLSKANPIAQTEAKKEPEGPKPISQNDVAIGYAILLIIVGLGYLGNVLFGGTCFVSDRLNAICALTFFCIPAFCAACLLSGDKDLRLKGIFAAVPALMIALWGSWYYHLFDQIKSNIGPYGDRVATSQENGWDICRYDCNWDYGNQTASTVTREKPAGPGLRFVRRMSFGELP